MNHPKTVMKVIRMMRSDNFQDDNFEPDNLTPTSGVRNRLEQLKGRREERERQSKDAKRCSGEIDGYLAITDQVTRALECLSKTVFEEVLGVVQKHATRALQEVLDQPIELKAQADFKRGVATVEFWIDREGSKEDVKRGQGGSVSNVLSVALRMLALARQDTSIHRRFLVLDEQDCWLKPDIVPKLVKIVRSAGRTMGFQVIMISHHDQSMFEQFADKVYRFTPLMGGVVDVREVGKDSANADGDGK